MLLTDKETRYQERLERMRIAKEEERCRKFPKVSLKQTKDDSYPSGVSISGLKCIFIPNTGMTEWSRYTGCFQVKRNDKWETIFTRGYISKALEWMSKN